MNITTSLLARDCAQAIGAKEVNQMPIPFKLDYVIERTRTEVERAVQRRALRRALAGVRVSARAAQAAWPRILEHKWYVSERLGRDVGLHVAAIDYFENVAPPMRMSRRWSDTLPPRLPMMQPLMKAGW
jgi:hypothetical protein